MDSVQAHFPLSLAQMGNKFSQLPLEGLCQFRSINGMALEPSMHSSKLHLIMVYFLFNVPLNSFG